jgi:hypothetical protein
MFRFRMNHNLHIVPCGEIKDEIVPSPSLRLSVMTLSQRLSVKQGSGFKITFD